MLSHLISAGLSRAAAHPAGLPLISRRHGQEGLFPPTKMGRTAAQKCLAEGWLLPVQATGASQPALAQRSASSERYVLSQTGWLRLCQDVQPRQVLEDFLRVVEKRTAAVTECLTAVQRLAEELHGLRAALRRWQEGWPTAASSEAPAARSSLPNASRTSCTPVPPGVSVPDATMGDLTGASEAILQALNEWSCSGGADCPLPALYRAAQQRYPMTLGTFHDALRHLHSCQALTLQPWTGPLYAIPEPACALLIGHGIAYYATPRTRHSAPVPAMPAVNATPVPTGAWTTPDSSAAVPPGAEFASSSPV
ncbi:MAG: hypothetical protein NZU63_04570 [Gemmataceae bacterium]|nr:hypothetical protein [Gemmataceae bacterium]MDW8241938.1 hypothetical protein [Thermogemmata sp.]